MKIKTKELYLAISNVQYFCMTNLFLWNDLFTRYSSRYCIYNLPFTTSTITTLLLLSLITFIATTTMTVVYRSFGASGALICISTGYRLCTYNITEYVLLNKNCFQYYWDPRISLVSCLMTTVWSNPSLAINWTQA